MTCKITIKNMADARALCEYAADCAYDTFVHGTSVMVDAKSLLGLMSLIGNGNLRFVIPDQVSPKNAFRGVERFMPEMA